MINYDALYHISYGLFIVSSGNKKKGNGFISNTVFQVSSSPAMFATCSNKNNYTSELIQQSKAFSASVLDTSIPPTVMGVFGFKSGSDVDKMIGMTIKYGDTGVPIVLNHCISYIECKLVQTIDMGSHWMFIGEMVNAEVIDDSKDALTYKYYREKMKGLSPKNAPTYIEKTQQDDIPNNNSLKKYKCKVCGYIYDEAEEGKSFEDLPDDWECPLCGVDKSEFIEE